MIESWPLCVNGKPSALFLLVQYIYCQGSSYAEKCACTTADDSGISIHCVSDDADGLYFTIV